MVEYEKAIQQSVYEQLQVVHEGRLKVFFTRDVKILSWEFCSRRHEELLPRELIVPQILSWEFCLRRHEELLPRQLIIPQGLCFLHILYAFENKHTRLARGGNANTDKRLAASLSVIKDCRLAMEINRMAEFMREIQSKDTEKMFQLPILGRETKLRAYEKESFT
nr:probable transcriptional regulator SLK2 [Tanacetum cinerariifolium]